MKINLKETLKSLAGDILVDEKGDQITFGKVLANMMISFKEGGAYEMDKMKLFVLAQKMYSDDSMDIDDADLIKVRSVVSNDRMYSPMIAGQIMMALSKAVDSEEKKDK